MSADSDTGRKLYIDYYRALAITLIVAWHMLYVVRGGLGAAAATALGVVTESGTMMFVFAAGYLFGGRNSAADFDFKKFFRSKIFNVLAPYAVASLLLLLWQAVKGGSWQGGGVLDFAWSYLKAVVCGTAAVQLWFIPMIMIFFALAKPFLWLNSRGWFVRLAPFLLLVPLLVGRGKHVEFWRNTIYFLPVYWYGMIAAGRESAAKISISGSSAMAMILVWLASLGLAVQFSATDWVQSGSKLLFMEFSFVLLRSGGARLDRLAGWSRPVAAASMGIYLYHNSVIGMLSHLSFCRQYPWPAFWVGTAAIVAGLTALLLLAKAILHKAGVKNSRMLTGV